MDINSTTIDAYSDGGAAEVSEEPLSSSLSDSTYEIISQSSFHTSDSEGEDHDSSDNDEQDDEVGYRGSFGHATSDEDHAFSSDDEDYDENDNGIALESTLTARDDQKKAEVSLQIPSPSMSSLSQIEVPIDFRQSVPSLVDPAASMREIDPLVQDSKCKFDEPPSSLRKDHVSVRHTVTNDFGWLSEPSTALTIRQSMTAHAFRCKSPFHILYHGHPNLRDIIIEKIAKALAVTKDSEEDGADNSIGYNVVSSSGVGTGKSKPGVIQIPSSDLTIVVEDCSMCVRSIPKMSNTPGQPVKLYSMSVLCLQEEILASRKKELVKTSRFNQIANQRAFRILKPGPNDQYTKPDLAIITHLSSGSRDSHGGNASAENSEQLVFTRTSHFLHEHSKQLKDMGIPTIDILEQSVHPSEVRADQFFHIGEQEALHMCVELNDSLRTSQNFALKRLPIDFPSFMKLDVGQLNRHIACLLQVYSNNHRSKYDRVISYARAAKQSLKRSVQDSTERARLFFKDKVKVAATLFHEANGRLDLWPHITLLALIATIMSILLACFIQWSLTSSQLSSVFGNLEFGSLHGINEMTTVYETVTVTPIPAMTQSPIVNGPGRWKSEAEVVWSNLGRLTGLVSDKQGEQKLYWKGVQFKVQQSDDGRILLLVSGPEGKAWKPLPGRVFIQHGEDSPPKPANLRSVGPGVFEMLLPQLEISEKLLIGLFPDPLEDVFVTFSFNTPDSKSAYLKNSYNVRSSVQRSVQTFYDHRVEDFLSAYRKQKSALSEITSSNMKKIDSFMGNMLGKLSVPRNNVVRKTESYYQMIRRTNPRQYLQEYRREVENHLRQRMEILGRLSSSLLEGRVAVAQIPLQVWRQLGVAQSRMNGFKHKAYRDVTVGANKQAKDAKEATQNTMHAARSAVQSARERLLSLKDKLLPKPSVAEHKLERTAELGKPKLNNKNRNLRRVYHKKNKGKYNK